MWRNKQLKMLVIVIKDSLRDYQISQGLKSRRKSKPSFYNDNCKLKVKDNAVNIEKVGWGNIKPYSIPLGVKYSNPV